MDHLKLLMWMLFTVSILALALVAFGPTGAQDVGGGTLGGVAFLSFCILFWKGITNDDF